jgi:hypothetical protein
LSRSEYGCVVGIVEMATSERACHGGERVFGFGNYRRRDRIGCSYGHFFVLKIRIAF